jgi:hypothetical protein
MLVEVDQATIPQFGRATSMSDVDQEVLS